LVSPFINRANNTILPLFRKNFFLPDLTNYFMKVTSIIGCFVYIVLLCWSANLACFFIKKKVTLLGIKCGHVTSKGFWENYGYQFKYNAKRISILEYLGTGTK
jgi:hypothetical protein